MGEVPGSGCSAAPRAAFGLRRRVTRLSPVVGDRPAFGSAVALYRPVPLCASSSRGSRAGVFRCWRNGVSAGLPSARSGVAIPVDSSARSRPRSGVAGRYLLTPFRGCPPAYVSAVLHLPVASCFGVLSGTPSCVCRTAGGGAVVELYGLTTCSSDASSRTPLRRLAAVVAAVRPGACPVYWRTRSRGRRRLPRVRRVAPLAGSRGGTGGRLLVMCTGGRRYVFSVSRCAARRVASVGLSTPYGDVFRRTPELRSSTAVWRVSGLRVVAPGQRDSPRSCSRGRSWFGVGPRSGGGGSLYRGLVRGGSPTGGRCGSPTGGRRGSPVGGRCGSRSGPGTGTGLSSGLGSFCRSRFFGARRRPRSRSSSRRWRSTSRL